MAAKVPSPILLYFFVVVLVCMGECAVPTQIHLAFGEDPHTMMTVQWATPDFSHSVVLYGTTPGIYTHNVTGECWKFTQGNPDGLQFINRVNLTVFLLVLFVVCF
jgi:hypothetical protein